MNLHVASLGLAAALLTSACPAWADKLDDIREAGVLRVAVPQDFPPFGFTDASMEIVGYDIDMSRLIADGLGVELEVTPVTSANRIPYMTADRVDLIVSSLGKNPEREQVIDFSVAYAPFFSGVYGPADAAVSDAEDMAGKSLAVIRGSTEDLAITGMAPAEATIQRFEDGTATAQAFLSGQTDLLVAGNVVTAALIESGPSRVPEMKFMIEDSPCYVGIPKGEAALVEAVNAIIAGAKADGTLNGLAQTWLHDDLPAGF